MTLHDEYFYCWIDIVEPCCVLVCQLEDPSHQRRQALRKTLSCTPGLNFEDSAQCTLGEKLRRHLRDPTIVVGLGEDCMQLPRLRKELRNPVNLRGYCLLCFLDLVECFLSFR